MARYINSLPVDAGNQHQAAFLTACTAFRAQLSSMDISRLHDEQQIFMKDIQRLSEYLTEGMNYILRVNVANDEKDSAYDYYVQIIEKVKKVIDSSFAVESVLQLRSILENQNKVQFRAFNKNAYMGIGFLLAFMILFATMMALLILVLPYATSAVAFLIDIGIIFASIGGFICLEIGLPKTLRCFLSPLGSSLIKKIDERPQIPSSPFAGYGKSVIALDNVEQDNVPVRTGFCGALSAYFSGFFYHRRPTSMTPKREERFLRICSLMDRGRV